MIQELYNEPIRTNADRDALKRQLQRLRSDEFAMVRRFLKQTMMQRLDTLAKSTDPQTVWRMQGQVKALEDLLEAVERSTLTS